MPNFLLGLVFGALSVVALWAGVSSRPRRTAAGPLGEIETMIQQMDASITQGEATIRTLEAAVARAEGTPDFERCRDLRNETVDLVRAMKQQRAEMRAMDFYRTLEALHE